MPNHVHLLLEEAPWQDLRRIMHEVRGITVRRLLQRFEWRRGELDSRGLWMRGYHHVCHTDASLATVQAPICSQRRAGGLSD